MSGFHLPAEVEMFSLQSHSYWLWG